VASNKIRAGLRIKPAQHVESGSSLPINLEFDYVIFFLNIKM